MLRITVDGQPAPPRVDKVKILVETMLAAAGKIMEQDGSQSDATADEFLNACFTLGLRAVKVCKAGGGNMSVVRESLEEMMLHCEDENLPVM